MYIIISSIVVVVVVVVVVVLFCFALFLDEDISVEARFSCS